MYKIFSKPNGCIIPSNMLTVADIIIIATLLSGAFISPFLFSFNRDKAEFVSITDVSIMKTENYPLNEIRYINIECGGYCFYVEINDGEVLIKESNCPNQICAKTPPIKKNGGVIVCIPAKLIIEIKGGGTSDNADFTIK